VPEQIRLARHHGVGRLLIDSELANAAQKEDCVGSAPLAVRVIESLVTLAGKAAHAHIQHGCGR
jgi:hypothetical protein